MHEFKKDAEALLAPFKNRIPAGVKGLDAVLTEYVAFKEADERRRAAVAGNPLAARMYAVLEECAAGVVAKPREAEAAGDASAGARAPPRGRVPSPPPPSPSPRSAPPAAPPRSPASSAMPPRRARSPHRAGRKARAGAAAPRRNPYNAPGAVNGGSHQSSDAAAERSGSDPSNAVARRSRPFDAAFDDPGATEATGNLTGSLTAGSLDDDGYGLWRAFELPAELGEARVQERLAEILAENITTSREARGRGREKVGDDDAHVGGSSPGGGGGSDLNGLSANRGVSGAVSPGGTGGVGAVAGSGAASSDPVAGAHSSHQNAASSSSHAADFDVDRVMASLFDANGGLADDELGRLLAPLLEVDPQSPGAAAAGATRARTPTPTPTPTPPGKKARREGVGDAFGGGGGGAEVAKGAWGGGRGGGAPRGEDSVIHGRARE